jgi:hypothetical protein
MSAALIQMNVKIQEFTSTMEARRLPSLRIQNKLRAPSQPIYEPLALRTRHRGGDKKEPSEPTRDDILKQQKEGRAERFARRQEALELEREKKFLNEFSRPSPSPAVEAVDEPKKEDPKPAPPPVELDRLDILINSVIEKAGEMAKSLKRKKRPKGANQFYDDDTFMPADDVKYLRVENLSGNVKAEVRKQMSQGRAARLSARNDPTSSKPLNSEISLSTAITNVKQQHQETPPQSSATEIQPNAAETRVNNNNTADIPQFQQSSVQPPPPTIPKRPLFTHLTPVSVSRPSALPNVSYRRPALNNVVPTIPTNYRLVTPAHSSQRTMYIHSPGDQSSTRLIRVIRQPSLRYSTPIIRPVRSQTYLNNGTSMPRPTFQQTYVRRVYSYEPSPRMVVPPTTGSLKPGIYRQTTPNTFIQSNNNLSSTNVFPINSNYNGIETELPKNGKITENGTPSPATLKHFDPDQANIELLNGTKPEEKVLSANQSTNQNF